MTSLIQLRRDAAVDQSVRNLAELEMPRRYSRRGLMTNMNFTSNPSLISLLQHSYVIHQGGNGSLASVVGGTGEAS